MLLQLIVHKSVYLEALVDPCNFQEQRAYINHNVIDKSFEDFSNKLIYGLVNWSYTICHDLNLA